MSRPNSCHNRAPFKPWLMVQNGWYMDGFTRAPRMETFPFRNTVACVYSADPLIGSKDAGCAGCRWKQP